MSKIVPQQTHVGKGDLREHAAGQEECHAAETPKPMSKLKNGKSSRADGVDAEMIKQEGRGSYSGGGSYVKGVDQQCNAWRETESTERQREEGRS